MERIRKHLRIGRRWLLAGTQLFLRNPWLLGGMGFTAAAVLAGLELIPVAGGLLVALIAPVMLASVYLSLDVIFRANLTLPAELRWPALKQSPRQLLEVFRSEQRLLPAATASAICVATVLLIHLLVRLAVGDVWVADWSNFDSLTRLGMLALALLSCVLYVLLAASMVYALPLAFLRDEPLLPSLRQSLKASRHFTVALLILLGVLLLPFVLAAFAAALSPLAGYLLWLVSASVVLPLVSAALYCSYQDIFSARDKWMPVDRRRQVSETVTPDDKSLRPL